MLYKTKTHWWLQEFAPIYWNDPDQGGAYVAAPPFWLTDFTDAPGAPDARRYDLPADMPQIVPVVGCWMRTEKITPGQIAVHVDYERNAYATGLYPPYHQRVGPPPNSQYGDFSRFSTLASLKIGEQETREKFPVLAPRVFDRAVDSLWLQADVLVPMTLTVEIAYLVGVDESGAERDWLTGLPLQGWSPPAPAPRLRSVTPPLGNVGAGYGYTNADMSFKLPNGLNIASIDVCSFVAGTVVPMIIQKDAATGKFAVVRTLPTQAHNGTGWQQFADAYQIPAVGDFYAAYYSTAQMTANPNTARAYLDGQAAGSNLVFTENVNNAAAVGVTKLND